MAHSPQESLGRGVGAQASVPAVGPLHFVLGLASVVVLLILATVPLEWKSQAILGAVLFAFALIVERRFKGHAATVFLMLLSGFCTLRYLWWRCSETFSYLAVNGSLTGWTEIFVVFLLLGAEFYAFLILLLGYFQNLRPLGRRPAPLPADSSLWPSVDVLIPTYNEPLEIVRATVLAALAMDWPRDRMHVYVLDDGKRSDVHNLALACGAGYFARIDNEGAKAGNINHAMARTNSEYVAVFDCDHVPTRSFLQMTLGLMVQQPKIAMVQTPHHFYSPDPFERNLGTFRKIPNEGELFYGVVQDGNDFWNSAFFCGSCATLRRSALDEVGGIATETVTEDSHTALRLQKSGWNTAYLKIPQAAGLATANIADHIKQRIRWARGMVQVLRVENPLFSGSLTMAQRLCYFNSGLHFLHALPRLIFLTAPLVYLLLGISNLYGYVWAILAYVLPHLLLASLTNSRVHGRYRHSFWNEVFETVLAPYILAPTLLALVNPRWGTFNVTPKRSVVEKNYFDLRIAFPFLVLLFLNALGLGVAAYQFTTGLTETGTLIVNMFWTTVNILILGAALAVMWERRQLRPNTRIERRVPALLRLSDHTEVAGTTLDLSLSGAGIQVERPISLRTGDRAVLSLSTRGETYELPVEIRREQGLRLGLRFQFTSLAQHQALTRLLFGRADAWIQWSEGRQEDRPMRSLARLVGISLWSILSIPKGFFSSPRAKEKKAKAGKQVPVLPTTLILAAVLFSAKPARAAEPFVDLRDLPSLGVSGPITFRAGQGQTTLSFGVPLTKVVTDAALSLAVQTSGSFRPELSKIQISLNGVSLETQPLSAATASGETKQFQVQLPAELIVADNTLTVAWKGICLATCRENLDWFRLEKGTTLRLSGSLLPMANNLSLLPVPFVDATSHTAIRVPFVFTAQPDGPQLQAAGAIASWIGITADDKGASFPTRIGMPLGENAIVFALAGTPLLKTLGLETLQGPTLAMRDNPADPYGKLLIVAGNNSSEILLAAQSLVANVFPRQGDAAVLTGVALPARSQPYDAPRWINPDKSEGLTAGIGADRLRVYGAGTVDLYFRLPPDLSYGQRSTVPLRLNYRTGGSASATRGEVRVRLNGVNVSAAGFDVATSTNLVRQTVQLPVAALYPSNTLSIEFSYPSLQATVESFPEATVLPTTTIDLRGVARYVQLPRLDLFSTMGFPFTRLADLSETAVVLPEMPSADVISLYLSLMGRIGGQTGSPALRVTVTSDASAAEMRNKDLLVVGLASDAAFLSRWSRTLPAQVSSGGLRLTPVAGPRDWLRRIPFTSAYEEARRLSDLSGEPTEGVLEGAISPLNASRNLVLVAGTDEVALPAMIRAFSAGAGVTGIDGSVAVLRDGSFQSFHIETDSSYLGRLSLREDFNNWMANRFWLLALIVVLLGIPVSRWLSRWTDRHAAARLQGS